MSLRFSNSKDGVPRANISVTFRVGTFDLARGLVSMDQIRYADQWSDGYEKGCVDFIAAVSRGTIERATRKMFEEHGWLCETVTDDCSGFIYTRAILRVCELFPELDNEVVRAQALAFTES